MHAIADGGCVDTVREYALKVDNGEKKNPRCNKESHLPQWQAAPTLYQLSYILARQFLLLLLSSVSCTSQRRQFIYPGIIKVILAQTSGVPNAELALRFHL